MEASLLELFHRYGTDKGGYAPVYECFLASRRADIRRVLEIGIGTLSPAAQFSMHGYGASHYRPGGSLRCRRDYFGNAEIIGIDIEPDTQFEEPRIRTFLCDSTDRQSVSRLIGAVQLGPFDLIIDDGSHRAVDQVVTLKNFLPLLGDQGLYVIEDVWEDLTPYNDEIVALIGSALMFHGSGYNPVLIHKIRRTPECFLRADRGGAASLLRVPEKPGWMRIVIEKTAVNAWDIQVNLPFYEIAMHSRYSIRFLASADRRRRMAVGSRRRMRHGQTAAFTSGWNWKNPLALSIWSLLPARMTAMRAFITTWARAMAR
jgi:hypothetical protein